MIPISKPIIGEAEKQAVLSVLESGMLAQGPRTAELEARFAQVCGVKHAVAASSGTAALHLALLANGIAEGDEVITTPFTFIASANTILFAGAKPIFVDIEADTFNIDPNRVEAAITPRTKAIMPVHLYGHMCDMDALRQIARRCNLILIEDACQAIGATAQGRPAGSFGTGAFSLYATKNVMAAEGGVITTDDEVVADRCRLLRNHGMRRRYYHDMPGYNFRLSDVHAAIGLAQIHRLSQLTAARRENARYFNAHIESVITPTVKVGYEHVWHQYTVRLGDGRDRDAAVQKLNEAGIGTGIFYPVPAHRQGYMRKLVGDVSLPVAERMAREVISLPVHPQLTPADREKIVREVNRL
ncbi:MAG: DegT/DnrJ/EryC1/StrS family aminotransferase [Anaerolineae bacterium]